MGRKPKNEIVKKSNALIRGHWEIESIWEPRLVALLASKVRVKDEDFKIYEIPVSEVIGQDYSGRDIKELAHTVDRVMSRVLTIYDTDGRGWTKYNLFRRCRYRPKEGILELGFDPDLRPHYLNLQERFTQYSLTEFMALPSIYSQRLYEILKSWSDKPEVTIAFGELCDMLDVPASLKSNFAFFRRRVLDKAYKDITEREGSSLWFDWEAIRKGKGGKVAAVRFVLAPSLAAEMRKNQKQEQANGEIFIHQQLQRKSNTCYERLTKRGQTCTPQDSDKCRFCVERGRLAFHKKQGSLNL